MILDELASSVEGSLHETSETASAVVGPLANHSLR